MSEAIEITPVNGRLTGPIFLPVVDQLHLLEFRSRRSKDGRSSGAHHLFGDNFLLCNWLRLQAVASFGGRNCRI
jgi:hypothetical protein